VTPPTARRSAGGTEDPRIRRSWLVFAGAFFLLSLIAVLRLWADTGATDWAMALLIVVVGFAAVRHRVAVHDLEAGRRAEAESFARILQGLSRSVSPDAILGAIVEELGSGTGADHIVIVRRRPDARVLEATLVNARSGGSTSSTLFPIGDLEDPVTLDTRDRPLVGLPIASEEDSGGSFAPRPERLPPATTAGLEVAAVGPRGMTAVRHSGRRMPAGSPAAPLVPAAALAATRPLSAVSDRGPSTATRATAGGSSAATVLAPVGTIHVVPSAVADALELVSPGDDDAWTSGVAGRVGRNPQPDPDDLVAERIAVRARSVFGLRHTLVAPLATNGGMIGALLISRRTVGEWPASAHRLLAGASVEASAALSRAYSHRQAEARASTDALTGLPNRRYFDEFCALLARRRRAEDSVGVLMVDIDRFKTLNDAHGHQVGDEVLRAVAAAIVGAVREDDVPARYGGEEFAVLLRNPTAGVAVEVGERVREAVASLDLDRYGVSAVTVSVGSAVAHDPDEPIVRTIERADRALYAAKRQGRDRVVAA
jgi:diguanylate cyclase (GGDEF)-like protein